MKITHLGDHALSVSLNEEISESVHDRILAICHAVKHKFAQQKVTAVPAYQSLVVTYDPGQITSTALTATLEEMEMKSLKRDQGQKWTVPTCYQGDLAPDLHQYAMLVEMDPEEVIRLHTGRSYRVYMLGFVPGFVYLGCLPQRLYSARKATPLLRIPAGSVGVAGLQTGIYPGDTPGGWHLIGRTPMPLLSRSDRQPSPFRAGDEVKFKPIALQEFYDLKQDLDQNPDLVKEFISK